MTVAVDESTRPHRHGFETRERVTKTTYLIVSACLMYVNQLNRW